MRQTLFLITMCVVPFLATAQHIVSFDGSVPNDAKIEELMPERYVENQTDGVVVTYKIHNGIENEDPLYTDASSYIEQTLRSPAVTAKDDYTPLVEEGKTWSFVTRFPPSDDGTGALDNGYKVWFNGDTIIGGKTYKKCYYRFHAPYGAPRRVIDIFEHFRENILVGFVREEGHKVYAIHDLPNPTGIQEDSTSAELLIYDFDDVTRPYTDWNLTAVPGVFKMESTDNLAIAEKTLRGYVLYNGAGTNVATIIEGVGINTYLYGDLLRPMISNMIDDFWYGSYTQKCVSTDDNYVFESLYKDPSGVTEVEVEKKGDGRYYNMMGQPVGDNPAPGIYIKDGRKVIVR